MLTLKEVWKIMAELWDWCAENPDQEKADWPGWADYEFMVSDCPCCEYVRVYIQENETFWGVVCPSKCPAVELWPNHCEKENSPYYRWLMAKSDEDAAKAAKEIADFARRKLEEVSE